MSLNGACFASVSFLALVSSAQFSFFFSSVPDRIISFRLVSSRLVSLLLSLE